MKKRLIKSFQLIEDEYKYAKHLDNVMYDLSNTISKYETKVPTKDRNYSVNQATQVLKDAMQHVTKICLKSYFAQKKANW